MSAQQCDLKRVIADSALWESEVFHRGTTSNIIDVITMADKRSDQFVKDSSCLIGPTPYQTANNVWRFLRDNIKYAPDKPGLERVKSPGSLFKIGRGDCKSMSIAIAALLKQLPGFTNIRYRFVEFDNSGDITHVYIVADIPGQKNVVIDAVHTRFDEEPEQWRITRRTDLKATPSNSQVAVGVAGFTITGGKLLTTAAIIAALIYIAKK